MPYLTDDEEKYFTSWLNGGVNPAVELLAELASIEINCLADLDRVAKKISNFRHATSTLMVTALQSHSGVDKIKSDAFVESLSGVRVVGIPPDLRLCFVSFCLQRAGASKQAYRNLGKYHAYLNTDSQESYYLSNLKDAFAFLETEKKLISAPETEKVDNDEPNPRIIRFKRLLAPLEDLCSDTDLPISKELRAQLNDLFVFLKQEGDASLKKNQQNEKTIVEMRQLSFGVAKLLEAITDNDISNNSLITQNRLIVEFENKFLSASNDSALFKKAGEMLKTLVEEAHSTSSENIQKTQKKLSSDFLEPFDQVLQTMPQLKGEIDVLKELYQSDIEHRVGMGRSKREIWGALAQSRDSLVQTATLCFKSPSAENDKKMKALLLRARVLLEARQIINPLDIITIHSKLDPSNPLGKSFHDLYKILQNEIESSLEGSHSKQEVCEKFDPFVNELGALARTLVNEELSREEKLLSIQRLKTQVEANYDPLLPPWLIAALQELLSVAFVNFFISTVIFFKPISNKERNLRKLVMNAETEAKHAPSVPPKTEVKTGAENTPPPSFKKA